MPELAGPAPSCIFRAALTCLCLAWCRNVVEFVPGGDIIKVSGTTHFEYIYKFINKHLIGSDDVTDRQ